MNHMPSHVKKKMGTLINITLELKGVTSYFPTRKPTKHEFDNCTRIELSYLTPEWDPHSTTFQEQEETLMDNKVTLHEWSNKRKNVDRYISIFDTVLASSLTECQDDPTHNLALALNVQVQVSGIVLGVNTKKRKTEVTPYDLAKRWNIGLETAKKTLLKTTLRGVRTSPSPLLSQWYSTNDRILRYRRLPVDLFTDIIEPVIVSHRGNRYTQIYAHRNTWCKAYLMAKKAMHMRHCHSCLHKRVPSSLIMDGAREQVMGEFRHKARQADCHVKQTEPYSHGNMQQKAQYES